jgi:2-polyprenyl-6-methoxyphenol hydroxylase-like FAD-dependent oxidoreductase
LEGAPPYKPLSREKYNNRVSAINKQSVNLLQNLGAWEHIESVRCKPIMQMQVWDAVSGESIEFSHTNFADSVAYIVENDLILEGLYKQLNNLSNVRVQNKSSVESCKLIKDGADKNSVKLKSGEEMQCDLLVSIYFFNSLLNEVIHLIISSTLFVSCDTFVSNSLT